MAGGSECFYRRRIVTLTWGVDYERSRKGKPTAFGREMIITLFVQVLIATSLLLLQSACGAVSVPLVAPSGSQTGASHHNAQGIAEYENKEWGMARYHFGTAIAHDPKLAEAHFNLGLTLHQLDLHPEATTHFKKAAELAPQNRAIVESRIYKTHTAPSSSFSSPATSERDPSIRTDRFGRQERYYEIYRSP